MGFFVLRGYLQLSELPKHHTITPNHKKKITSLANSNIKLSGTRQNRDTRQNRAVGYKESKSGFQISRLMLTNELSNEIRNHYVLH
jgi:hypothetical protein